MGFNWIERRLNYVFIECDGHGAGCIPLAENRANVYENTQAFR